MARCWPLLLLVVTVSPTPASDASAFCAGLEQAVAAAEAGDRFAAVTGADTGLHHLSTLELAGAKTCRTYPDDCPDASWRCLISTEGKYVHALQDAGNLAGRVAGCLGDAWSREDVDGGDYLTEVRFTRSGSGARVRVIATREIEGRHSIVLTVFSSQE
jgi:hypothetical protein